MFIEWDLTDLRQLPTARAELCRWQGPHRVEQDSFLTVSTMAERCLVLVLLGPITPVSEKCATLP